MPNIIEELLAARRNITIIGIIAITDKDYWPIVKDKLLPKISERGLHILLISESDNQLHQYSLRTDTSYTTIPGGRIAFNQLKFRRNMIYNELAKHSNTDCYISSLPIPINIIKIDDQIWYHPSTGHLVNIERFKQITPGDTWYEIIESYLSKLSDTEKDGRYLSSREAELLELFDQNHIPRGIYPRDSFYNTDHFQLVVWGFVFSRKGELLIHKRDQNAKDNLGCWDKSIGGHIDYEVERSTSDAAVRELIEELYIKEKKEQTGKDYSLLSDDKSKLYNLGEWRPGELGEKYLLPISLLEEGANLLEEPWVFYKIPGTIEHDTPRILPDGSQRKLRVLADVFIFIANTGLTIDYAHNHFTNSKFDLIEPALLKTWIDNGVDSNGEEFKATPDLNFIMSGKFRTLIDEVSQLIQYAEVRK